MSGEGAGVAVGVGGAVSCHTRAIRAGRSGVGTGVGVGVDKAAANEASTCRATIACRSGVGTDTGVAVGKVAKIFDTPAVIVAWRSGVAAGETLAADGSGLVVVPHATRKRGERVRRKPMIESLTRAIMRIATS